MATSSNTAVEKVLDTNDSLQIGIEIEFLAPCDKVWEEAHKDEVPFNLYDMMRIDVCHKRIAEKLHEAGIPTVCGIVTHTGESSGSAAKFLVKDVAKESFIGDLMRIMGDPANIDRTVPTWARPYKYWVIKEEGDIDMSEEEIRSWIRSELNTPIIPEHDVLRRGMLAGLDNVLDIVSEVDSESKIHLNDTCGLHVHVSPEPGMTLLFAKRVATLAIALDDTLLFTLCDKKRRDFHDPIMTTKMLHDYDKEDAMTQEISEEDMQSLPKNLFDVEEPFLRRFWATRSLAQLARKVECMTEYGRERVMPALLFKTVPSVKGGRTMTLEFRHAQATMSTAFIKSWAHLVMAICRIALLPAPKFRGAMEALYDLVPEEYFDDTLESRLAEQMDNCLGFAPEAGIWLKQLRVLNEHYLAAGGEEPGLDEDYWVQRVMDMRHCRGSLDCNENGESTF